MSLHGRGRLRYGIGVRFISHLLPKTGLKYPYIWVLVERKRNILYLLFHLRIGMESPLRTRLVRKRPKHH
jgi:hypothetical protein